MKIGSLVECVNTGKTGTSGDLSYTQKRTLDAGYTYPKIGEIGTVRGFTRNGKGLFLEEHINPVLYPGGFEVGFTIHCFRELQPPMDLTELLTEQITLTV